MTTALPTSSDTSTVRRSFSDRYDRVTIAFHWVTAALVVFLFGSAWLWNNTPRAWHLHTLEWWHVSFGILFAVVLIARLLWRWIGGRHLPEMDKGAAVLAANVVHAMLYLLLALQAVLGFGLRWVQGDEFSFFGLFAMPDPFQHNPSLAHLLQQMHNFFGWTILIVAGGHAVAALIHHFVLGDRLLSRMLPVERD